MKTRVLGIMMAMCLLMMGVSPTTVSADAPKVTYGLEYTDDSVTLTLYLTEIEAFDIAIAYDPAKLTVSDLGFTRDFKLLQAQNNTTISVQNEDAKDDVGNTYVIFTGAGSSIDSGEAIPFAGIPLATVTFQGDIQNSSIKVVTDSAAVTDINAAPLVADIVLGQTVGTTVTPEPIAGVTYNPVTSADNQSQVGDSATTSDNATQAEATTEVTDAPETEAEEAESTATEAVNTAEAGDNKEENKTSGTNILVFVILGLALAATAAVIVIRYMNGNKNKEN